MEIHHDMQKHQAEKKKEKNKKKCVYFFTQNIRVVNINKD
jgi:hypothetical protein